ncbi:MAG: Crp/Fnr family transcriptional regulator [Tepidiformaceae bacterium]
MTEDITAARGNGLLAALPHAELQRLLPRLTPLDLPRGTVLNEAEEHVHRLYFPTSGVVSAIVEMEDGTSIEAGMIGREGIACVSVLFDCTAGHRLAGQIAGSGFASPAEPFMRDFWERPALREPVLHYVGAFTALLAQTAACNGCHPVEARLARWLLMVCDRVDGDILALTHETISQMLGVQRPTVSLAANTLQQAGLIQYRQGRISVLDRGGLEGAACECYRVIRDRFKRLLPN